MTHYCGAREAGRIVFGCEPQCDECRDYEHAECDENPCPDCQQVQCAPACPSKVPA